MTDRNDLDARDVNWKARIAYVVRMNEVGTLALEEDREIQRALVTGSPGGLTVKVWKNEVNRAEWIMAGICRRAPAHYLYACAYGGPGKKVPYTTIRIENAKVYKTEKGAARAAKEVGGTVMAVLLERQDGIREDEEFVPWRILGKPAIVRWTE